MECLKKIYGCVVCAGNRLQSPVLLLIRLAWGWQFFEAGKGKLEDIPKVAGFFEQLHIPMPTLNAYVAGTTECFGGLLLVFGLGARIVSAPLAFTMIVAYLTAHMDAVKTLFENPDEFLSAAPFPFLVAALVILAFGPGKLSLDHLIERCWLRQKKTTAP